MGDESVLAAVAAQRARIDATGPDLRRGQGDLGGHSTSPGALSCAQRRRFHARKSCARVLNST
jgi:hypothetical protein